MSMADDLRSMNLPGTETRMQTVSAIGADGTTVNLATGGTPLIGVPCLEQYSPRRVGDEVLVLQLPSGSDVVIGCPGRKPTHEGITEEQIKGWIADVAHPPVTVSYSDAAPSGEGWEQATALPWIRDDGDGARSVHLQMASGSGGGGGSQPPARTPNPVTINPIAHGSWRTNGHTSGEVIQGPAHYFGGSSARWTGGIFYGSKIADEAQAGVVDRIEVTLARKNSGHGWNRAVPLHIGLHDRQQKGHLNKLNYNYIPISLERGEQRTFTLRGIMVNQLGQGSLKGIGITTSDPNDYLILTETSGQLRMVFQ